MKIEGLGGRLAVWKMLDSQYKKLCAGSYAMEGGAAMQHTRKVIVDVTFHDLTARRRLRGVGRWTLRPKSLKIYHQNNINDQIFGRKVRFEFKKPYKLCVLAQ